MVIAASRSATIHVVSLSCNPVPPPRYGGIELVVANLCSGLADIGQDVVCYSPGVLSLAGVRHARTLEVPNDPVADGGAANSEEHLREVRRQLLTNTRVGDVVIFNHPDHIRVLRRFELWWRIRVRIFEVAHWTHVALPKNIIYPSRALQEAIGKPGVVIPHGQKLEFVVHDPPRDTFLFFAGRISADKGIHLAADAAERLGVELVLAGPTPHSDYAAQLLRRPHVRYLGELSYKELLPWYARAAAVTYMTQYVEPFGLTPVEAMAAGTPVITTGYGGTGETVLPGQTGFFCRTVEEIVRAYARLNDISRAACRKRAQQYTVPRMAESYLRHIVI